jgi:hypothetical protein
MKFQLNWKNIAALLTGIAGITAALGGYVPDAYAEVIGGLSAGLLTVAGLLGDRDGDGIPNVVDADR